MSCIHPRRFYLGNAWDLLSALTLEKMGFKAIGTTSRGIANSLGSVDGEVIDFDRHLGIIKTITENVNIPVSADIEAGYGENMDEIVETDTYFQKENPLLETIDRAKSYMESGVSGIFVAGVTLEEEIKEIASNINAPLNVLSLPGLMNCNKLKELGVKRFSFGNALSDKYIEFLEKNAEKLVKDMDTSHLYEN
jgi:2-methylisocitrate lyase-like PEP mutase family enzyme